MTRISIPAAELAPAASRPLLEAVGRKLGVVPNLMKLVGNSPAALAGYLQLGDALGRGVLDAGVRERIALAVAQFNGCDYCLAAHAYLGRHAAGLGDSEISAARWGRSSDARAQAALQFALRVAQERGRVGDADLAAVRAAGHDEAAIVEIVVNVALNVLTNYVNNTALTDVDFPAVDAMAPA